MRVWHHQEDHHVASIMVDDATDGWALLADADESPTIARNGNGNGVGASSAGASARGGGTLGWQQKVGPITQQKDGIERQRQRMRMTGNDDDNITISHKSKIHKNDKSWRSQGD